MRNLIKAVNSSIITQKDIITVINNINVVKTDNSDWDADLVTPYLVSLIQNSSRKEE